MRRIVAVAVLIAVVAGCRPVNNATPTEKSDSREEIPPKDEPERFAVNRQIQISGKVKSAGSPDDFLDQLSQPASRDKKYRHLIVLVYKGRKFCCILREEMTPDNFATLALDVAGQNNQYATVEGIIAHLGSGSDEDMIIMQQCKIIKIINPTNK